MKKIFLLFLLLPFCIAYSQDTLLINSSYIPHTDTTLVYSPSAYDSAKSYPLVFMLHGWSGNYAQWGEIVNLQKYADKYKFVIVCPDGFYDSWYINSPVKKNSQYEAFFFKNLVPEIFAKFNIDKKNIFITGLSMGGHGAVYLFLKNPEFFKSAASTSGILDITAFPKNWGLPAVLGSMDTHLKSWQAHSDIYLIKNIVGMHKKLLTDCGTEDFSFKVNQAFAEKCRKDGVDITFLTGPGNHSRKYWMSSVPEHFKFFYKMTGGK